MSKIIFVNRFFHPDHSATSQMLGDLAFALAQRGLCVQVITSRQRYDKADAQLEALEEVRSVVIHRVWTSRFGRSNLIGRMVDYLSFYSSAAWRLLIVAKRGDIVVAKTDPPLLSVMAAPIVWLKRAQLLNWLQDLYPEVAQALGIGRGRFARPVIALLRWLRNRSLKSAKMNVVLGDLMGDLLRKEGIAKEQIHILPNWADGEQIKPVGPNDNALRHEWGLSDRFVVGYSGNFGRTHEFDTILAAAKIISSRGDEPKISFLFIGGGTQQKTLQQVVRNNDLDNVQFRPYQPRSQLAQSLSVADIHLVSLQPEFEGLIVPSKFYGIAAAGRATAYIGDPGGEIPQILSKYDCGFTVKPGDGDELAERLVGLAKNKDLCQGMGAKARTIFEQKYDLPIAIDRWQAVLDEFRQ